MLLGAEFNQAFLAAMIVNVCKQPPPARSELVARKGVLTSEPVLRNLCDLAKLVPSHIKIQKAINQSDLKQIRKR